MVLYFFFIIFLLSLSISWCDLDFLVDVLMAPDGEVNARWPAGRWWPLTHQVSYAISKVVFTDGEQTASDKVTFECFSKLKRLGILSLFFFSPSPSSSLTSCSHSNLQLSLDDREDILKRKKKQITLQHNHHPRGISQCWLTAMVMMVPAHFFKCCLFVKEKHLHMHI